LAVFTSFADTIVANGFADAVATVVETVRAVLVAVTGAVSAVGVWAVTVSGRLGVAAVIGALVAVLHALADIVTADVGAGVAVFGAALAVLVSVTHLIATEVGGAGAAVLFTEAVLCRAAEIIATYWAIDWLAAPVNGFTAVLWAVVAVLDADAGIVPALRAADAAVFIAIGTGFARLAEPVTTVGPGAVPAVLRAAFAVLIAIAGAVAADRVVFTAGLTLAFLGARGALGEG